jgi:geranylgeranyl pyrophosphate synthase
MAAATVSSRVRARRAARRSAAGAPTRRSVPSPAAVAAEFEGWRKSVDRYMARSLAGLDGVPPRLASALRYAVLGGGKRLRPQFVMLGSAVVGGRPPRALPAATAFELVHAFSLVHDDLPAMDNDDLRRGRPTLHRRFDEATAILAGDALLARAFEEMARVAKGGVPAGRCLEAARLLADAAGARGMTAGQYLDMQAEGRTPPATTAQVERIHVRKTGALFAAALEVGGVLGGAGPAARRALSEVGRDLGLAFQIVDDLLDERSTAARLGKPVHSDRSRGKATYPGAAGERGAERRVARLVARALARAAAFPRHAAHFAHVARLIADREA